MSRPLAPLAAIVLLLGALAPGGSVPVPWPHGGPPSNAALDALLADAQQIEDREQFEEWLAAAETGEDSEHLPIMQEDIDKGLYTKTQLFGSHRKMIRNARMKTMPSQNDGTARPAIEKMRTA